jgi:carboxymethylenebutenolidase
MWNQFRTDEYEAMLAERIAITGNNGDGVSAYFARPLGPGPFPGVVLVHHMPGWDELYREMACRFARHGYSVLMPNLYHRLGHGTPEEMAAKAREQRGVADDVVVGDCAAAMHFLKGLPNSNGKVGIVGGCSGGRHAFLAACRVKGFDAIIDCWGGNIVPQTPPTDKTPVPPVEYAKDLSCPMLGLFGNEDQNPTPDKVDQLEAELKRLGKDFEFHRYDGAGHGFWSYDRPAYRPQQAIDAWNKTFEFFRRHLKG